MIAYLGKPALKRKYLARVRAHRKANEIIHGTGWTGTKGCAVGCTIHEYNHARYPELLGVPETLAHLQDTIFEGLTGKASLAWPERFLAAIKPGADLSLVWPRFALWLLVDEKCGVLRFTADHPDCKKAVEDVAAFYREWVETGKTPDETRFAARAESAAWAAWAAREAREARAESAAWAAWAAWAAREARAASAARAESAASAARAAWAAWAAWAESAARAAWAAWAESAASAARAAWAAIWTRMADKLESLLREAPITTRARRRDK